MHTTRRLTRAERLAVIDLKVPGEDWQKGRVNLAFEKIISDPYTRMIDFNDCMDIRIMFDRWDNFPDDDADFDFDPTEVIF